MSKRNEPKKKYFVEYGDGLGNWHGTREVGNDMRYSNMLQEGTPLRDEAHALAAHLRIDEREITTRKTTKEDSGFSSVAGEHTLAVLCVRVWSEEVEEDEG